MNSRPRRSRIAGRLSWLFLRGRRRPGTLLLAREGINGTIAGPREGIDRVLDHVRTLPGCAGIERAESSADTMPLRPDEGAAEARDRDNGQLDVDPRTRSGTMSRRKTGNADHGAGCGG
ncbi:MAG: hypothetical protein R3D56_00610 [Paracoccaceae bacterium]